MADAVESTAFGPMVIVALEQTLPEAERIITDPVAYQMLPTYAKLMVKACGLKPIQRVMFNLLEKPAPGVYMGMVCRKRYIGDKVLESLSAGIDSLVLLGAGLDTLAYRLPQLASMRVFEVDLPDNIAYKRKQLAAIYGSVLDRVTLVPTDFESQKLEDVLQQAGYTFDQRSFFVWEGVTQYLTEAAVRETFQFLAQAKSGSRLVFTYVMKDFIDGKNLYGSDSLYQRFRVNSQVWQFGLDPRQVGSFIGGYGWKLLEQVDAADYVNRYLKPAGRTGVIAEIEPAVYAEKIPHE